MPSVDLATGLKICTSKFHEGANPLPAFTNFNANGTGYGDGLQTQCRMCQAESTRRSQERKGIIILKKTPYLRDPAWRNVWITRYLEPPYPLTIEEDGDGTITVESLGRLLDNYDGRCPGCKHKTKPVTHYIDMSNEHDRVFSIKCVKLVCANCSANDSRLLKGQAWSGADTEKLYTKRKNQKGWMK
jgi:hypothetical protein